MIIYINIFVQELTTGLPSPGIFSLRLPCSALRTSQAALRRTRGERSVGTLASLYVAPVAEGVSELSSLFWKNIRTNQWC
jgi:hypothetical protein